MIPDNLERIGSVISAGVYFTLPVKIQKMSMEIHNAYESKNSAFCTGLRLQITNLTLLQIQS